MSASTYRNLATASRIVKFWKDACDPSGWEPATVDAAMLEPCCMVCAYIPGMFSEMVGDPVNPKLRTWEGCGLERSHLHSHALGGSGSADNLIMACRTCNRLMPQKRSRADALEHLLNASWASKRFTATFMLWNKWRSGQAGLAIELMLEFARDLRESRSADQTKLADA